MKALIILNDPPYGTDRPAAALAYRCTGSCLQPSAKSN